jgi:hypothetical protein
VLLSAVLIKNFKKIPKKRGLERFLAAISGSAITNGASEMAILKIWMAQSNFI